MTMADTPVALCEYYGSPELAHYIQHNHLMSVSGDDDNNSNITVTGQVDHNNTNTHVKLEDSVIVESVINKNENCSNKVENSKSNNKRNHHNNIGCCNIV
jgi:hypothetical protein